MKFALGKIELHSTDPSGFPELVRQLNFEIIALSAKKTSKYHLIIGKWHKDPFDRMLIVQAMENGLTIITKDENITKYTQEGLKTIW